SRALEGCAPQLTGAGGDAESDVNQGGVSFYLQDDWRLRQHLTVSPGLRYENQNNIDSNFNFAPRIGFAWSPMFGKKKKQAAPAEVKNTTTDTPGTAPKPADAKNTTTTAAVPGTAPKAADAKNTTTTAAVPGTAPK